MPVALELPNKELTPQMERHGGGGSGRRKRMVWRRKGVAGGRRKGGELRAVESGTLCSSLCYAPALLPPQHPHLHPCSLTVRPLLRSGLAGMLTFTRTHPLNISHPSFSCKIEKNKREAVFSVTSCLWMWIMLVLKVACKTSETEKCTFCDVLVYLSAIVWLKISLLAAEGKSDSTRGSIKTHRLSSADLRLIPVRIIPASRAGVCADWEQDKYSHTVPVGTDSSKSNLFKFVSRENGFRVGVPQMNKRCYGSYMNT